MTVFLHASGVQVGAAYGALAIATMISPFFVGLIADRFFAAQYLMGVLHIIGGLLLYLATQVTDTNLFYWIILFYSLVYMPKIADTYSGYNPAHRTKYPNPWKLFSGIRHLTKSDAVR